MGAGSISAPGWDAGGAVALNSYISLQYYFSAGVF
jgi:hypothetical protein